MLTLIALFLIAVSVVFASLRLALRKSNSKKMLRRLTIFWIVTLLIAATLVAVEASKTFVASGKEYLGTWYNTTTGQKIIDVYRSVGGAGISPFVMFLMCVVFPGFGGFIFGSSLAFAKDRAIVKSAKPSRVFTFALFFVLYYFLCVVTVGIFPILRLNREKKQNQCAT